MDTNFKYVKKLSQEKKNDKEFWKKFERKIVY